VQIHTFISESATEAVAQIRSQLGPSAVVLSVRKLPRSGLSRIWSSGQIEVTASLPEEIEIPPVPANDPISLLRNDQQDLRPFPDNSFRPPQPAIAATIAPQYQSTAKSQSGWTVARCMAQSGMLPIYAEQIGEELAERYGSTAPDFPRQIELAQAALRLYWRPSRGNGIEQHVFLGPAGAGKSTVLCKWLAQNILVSNRPATVFQLDTHTANTSSLPGLYSEILGAKFERALPDSMEQFEGAAFVDLPGISTQSEKALPELAAILKKMPHANVHLVLNGAYDSSLLLEQTRFFSRLGVSGIILTHLDEEPRWGKFWNLLFGSKLPIRFFSSGQNIPGEFTSATAERLFLRQFRGK